MLYYVNNYLQLSLFALYIVLLIRLICTVNIRLLKSLSWEGRSWANQIISIINIQFIILILFNSLQILILNYVLILLEFEIILLHICSSFILQLICNQLIIYLKALSKLIHNLNH